MMRGDLKTRRQRGNAMLELAICFPTFLLVIMGAMDFSWGVNAYNFCSYAAQGAARWGSVHGSLSSSPATVSSVTTYVQTQAKAEGLSVSNLKVTPCWAGDCPSSGSPASGENAPGQVFKVTIAYKIVPLTGFGIKSSFTVSSTGQYVINH